MKKINLTLTAMLAIALCLTACSGNDDIEVNNVTLNETSLSLIVGDEFTLTATVLPDNATSQNVVWSSSNPAVASVANGVVTAITAGDATITAQAGSKTATCEVSVIDGVRINGVVWATRNVDMPNTFAATPESYGMFYQWGRKIAWSVANPLVNSDGGTEWNTTIYEGESWTSATDPSPAGWRVPVFEELESLIDETKVASEWTTQNGVTGRKFTDITTDASIFLPAVGFRLSIDGTLRNQGNQGRYWSSAKYDSSYGYYLYFGSDGVGQIYNNHRLNSFPIRCVAE